MADRLRFHPHMVSDLRDAVSWYDEISVDLGNRFRMAVRTCFAEIAEKPNRFGRTSEGIRFARVKRFPYVVLFEEAREAVSVLGVFHAASDPKRWKRRSSEK